ncbi:hypothetical protein QE152_g27107 [Popillia japonica]|uniref:Uncharacterized protein n=1 Tax=Popillia japonica TaxID=7064 RepID=A0AAW1JX99_POPJA
MIRFKKLLLFFVALLTMDITSLEQNWTWINSQIAADPGLQYLRQFAFLHQRKAKITQANETFYLDGDSNFKPVYPILTEQNIPSSAITITVEVKCSTYYFSICWTTYWKNFYSLLYVNGVYIYYRLRNHVDENHQFVHWVKLATKLQVSPSDLCSTFESRDKPMILCIWNPLRSDVVGLGLSNNLPLSISSINLISCDKTSTIDTTNQSIIAYIRQDYLNSINKDDLVTSGDDLLVLIAFNLIQNKIGFRIPKFCSYNDKPPLQVYFALSGNWTTFGTFNIANSSAVYPTCFLERISFLGFNIITNSYHQSVETVQYCSPQTFNIGNYSIHFELTRALYIAFPKLIYLDDKLNLLRAECQSQSFSFSRPSYNLVNVSSRITNQTMKIYKHLRRHFDISYVDLQFELNSNTTYIDIYLYFLTLKQTYRRYSFDYMLPILIKGINLLQLEALGEEHISHLVTLVSLFVYTRSAENLPTPTTSDIITFRINKTIPGVAFYKDNSTQAMLSRIATDKTLFDNNIDVVVQLSDNCINTTFKGEIWLFTDNFYYKKTNLSKTKIVGMLYSYNYFDPTPCIATKTPIDVYLRLANDGSSGYWHKVNVPKNEVPIILIITCNVIVYTIVMINLWKSDVSDSRKKYRIRATVALPFMLGLVWVVMASVMAPIPIISLVGWYLFYFIIPSQGFILFTFMILLDEDTRRQWLELLRIKKKGD